MAQPVNTFDSYDMRGIREDLSDIVYNIDPEEVPAFNAFKKVKATNTFTEWQTDSLRASADNAHIEGDDTTATASTPTVRLGNYTQIFKDAAVVSGTEEGLDKAGRGDEMKYQVVKRMKEVRLDIEKAIFANQARVAGSSVLPRRMAGMGAWVATNDSLGAGGASPAGTGTDARTDGAPRALTQALFDAVMQSCWDAGGKADKIVFLSSGQMNTALGFVGNNTQRNTVSATTVSKDMDVYMTAWGKVRWQMSRECRTRDLWVVDPSKWAIGVLRPMQQRELASIGDNAKRQVLMECTLQALNEAASGLVADLS